MTDKVRLLSRKTCWIVVVPRAKAAAFEAAFRDDRFFLMRGQDAPQGPCYWLFCGVSHQNHLQDYLRETTAILGIGLDTTEN